MLGILAVKVSETLFNGTETLAVTKSAVGRLLASEQRTASYASAVHGQHNEIYDFSPVAERCFACCCIA